MGETITIMGIIALSAVYLGYRLRGLFRGRKSAGKPESGSCCGRICEGCECPCVEKPAGELHKIEILLLLLLPILFSGCFGSDNTPYYDPGAAEGLIDPSSNLRNFIVLDDENFDELTKYGYVFVNFTTDWCGVCKQMAPALESLEKNNRDRISFAKVDCGEAKVPKNVGLQNRFNVTGYPKYVLLYNGKVVFEHEGGFSESDMQFSLEMAVIDTDARMVRPSGMVVIPGGPGGGKLIPIDEVNPNDYILPEDDEESEEPEKSILSPENVPAT